jgi:hypothetical protein
MRPVVLPARCPVAGGDGAAAWRRNRAVRPVSGARASGSGFESAAARPKDEGLGIRYGHPHGRGSSTYGTYPDIPSALTSPATRRWGRLTPKSWRRVPDAAEPVEPGGSRPATSAARPAPSGPTGLPRCGSIGQPARPAGGRTHGSTGSGEMR